jgi:DNA polymerase delta subunit 1
MLKAAMVEAVDRRVHAAVLEDGITTNTGRPLAFQTFESNVLFVLRFMIDCGVVGGCWVTAKASRYSVSAATGATGCRPKLSTCQIDLHLSYR